MSTSPPCKEEGPKPQKISRKKKYVANGSLRTGWTQEELPRIIKKICETYPEITWIEVRHNEIHWNFEPRKTDLFPRPNEFRLGNPSKRKEKKDTLEACKKSMP